ncbi:MULTISPECIES: regulatory protein RecX [Alteromonadaceae]|uniref:regulatory protein RecX n=1 Tax=Alteromonadaceae TaxID=72275 RepID=UPI001C089184|nr:MULTISPECIES: regulatory protein RecX [Aliiglaciecola]MBU2879830.1 recombination regulator RecX [Aliiglaciecola lipolytica]MDO6709891.1 regulatory protein RecX [Aliiglaciecola sp. 2_MG-2023]MDO6751039.1 regulatory protein RecX [Aliiglaciecola sp. 1_MG-2023]
MSDNDVKIINHSITRLLARREHSQHELVTKLTLKGLDSGLVKQQIALFAEKDIQSDKRFVEAFIRNRVLKGQGLKRIQVELQQHNIDEMIVSNSFADCETDFAETAIQAYRKKYGDTPIRDWQDKQKRMRFLQYRGFNHEQIRIALKGEPNE